MNTSVEMADENAALVEQARCGSEPAFTELVRLHLPLVRSYLRRYLSSAEGVDDLAQQCFLVAYRRLETLNGRFSAWLLGIARNEALVYLRGEVRRKRREKRAAAMLIAEGHADRLEDPAESEEHQATMAALQACLEQLPASSREIVQKFYFGRQSTETIAGQMKKTSGSIRMTLMRIRRALGTCITERRTRQEYQS